LTDNISLLRIGQFDQDNVCHWIGKVFFSFRFRPDVVPGIERDEYGRLQRILLTIRHADHLQIEYFLLGALSGAQGDRIANP